MYSIYKITEIETGKIYIGMTSRISDRMRKHKNKSFRGKPFEYEILCKAENLNAAFELESFWTKTLRANDPEIGYNKNTGKAHGPISKRIMSEAQKKRTDRPFLGQKHTAETKAKMSALKKGKTPICAGHNSRAVQNIETGEIFEKLIDACQKYSLHKAALSRCCKGKQKTCGGFRWKFA